ncbi:competence protein CoiA [Pedobacter sp. MR2016-24]|uniref:competence protein CoiA n=1 Tax=Pedobacter sp. MR2016-24 TaxID=2994466 RepID=UPI002246ED19|nr:competence protein CoiA family protein [Pedobacter sp. MR2016-24]MCX2484856.1 competence protein CoiA family protein [Pedobacter sp. MR2016-24]
MQYALVNGIKSEPKKGLTGVCIGCGNQMIAKCGPVKLHHWAHCVNVQCDSWWETETEWHRQWKSHFQEEEREQTFYDEQLQEYHRADVYTTGGITIEFQNSPIALEELLSRERFYTQLVWVVNGLKFKGFNVTEAIPNPRETALKDYEFTGTSHLAFRKTDGRSADAAAQTISIRHPSLRHIKISSKHFTFSWRHPHMGGTAPKHLFLLTQVGISSIGLGYLSSIRRIFIIYK